MKIKYGVIGSGAIGGFYGSKLAHAGKEVHFLFHSDYHFVCENGLQVDSCDGSFHLDGVNAYQRTIDMPKCDVILVGLKSVNNALGWRRTCSRCSRNSRSRLAWLSSVRRKLLQAGSPTSAMAASMWAISLLRMTIC